jgi:hypothetical protein
LGLNGGCYLASPRSFHRHLVQVEAQTHAFACDLQRGRWGSEGRHPSISYDQGLLHEMISYCDAANRYRWAPHMQGGSAWAQGNMESTTAYASMPAVTMILMPAAMAAIFA